MKIGTVLESDAFVYSDPPKTFAQYFNQKKRHLQTSFHYLLKQKMFLGFWHLINLISLFSILLMLWNPFFALPFIIKLVFDFIVVIKNQKTLGYSFKFYEIIFLQIAFEIFLIINFFNSLFGKVEWK
jgi:cellulose synthase/poly-beta-1,6-N-acetylglucosamine synthase-like glycosyltransferase